MEAYWWIYVTLFLLVGISVFGTTVLRQKLHQLSVSEQKELSITKRGWWLNFASHVTVTIAHTSLAFFIVGLFLETPLQSAFIERFESGMWHVFVKSPDIADETIRTLVHAPIIYDSYEQKVSLEEKDGYLKGYTTRIFRVKNVGDRPFDWACYSTYSDVKIEAGGVVDSSLKITDSATKRVMVSWNLADELNKKGTRRDTIRILPDQVFTVEKVTGLGLGLTDEYYLQVKEPCQGYMQFELILPKGYDVDKQFLHKQRDNPTICKFDGPIRPDAAGDHYDKFVAKIVAGIFPFQGIMLSWKPKSPNLKP